MYQNILNREWLLPNASFLRCSFISSLNRIHSALSRAFFGPQNRFGLRPFLIDPIKPSDRCLIMLKAAQIGTCSTAIMKTNQPATKIYQKLFILVRYH